MIHSQGDHIQSKAVLRKRGLLEIILRQELDPGHTVLGRILGREEEGIRPFFSLLPGFSQGNPEVRTLW